MTTALTVSELAALMHRYARRADNPDNRDSAETNEVLLGKLTMLDVIAEGLAELTPGDSITAGESGCLAAARHDLGRAIGQLMNEGPRTGLIFEHGTANFRGKKAIEKALGEVTTRTV